MNTSAGAARITAPSEPPQAKQLHLGRLTTLPKGNESERRRPIFMRRYLRRPLQVAAAPLRMRRRRLERSARKPPYRFFEPRLA